MLYTVKKWSIASELAAKPPSRSSQYLNRVLLDLERCEQILDYGCGKLRYANILARRGKVLTLVDSERQLNREQIVEGKLATLRSFAENRWSNVRLETIEEFHIRRRPLFDFALCANVLSAIPSKRDRLRALTMLGVRLKRDGVALIVNQHTNSHFSELARRPDVVRYGDGWLIPGKQLSYFFAVLTTSKVAELLNQAGFELIEHYIEGQSNYARARFRG